MNPTKIIRLSSLITFVLIIILVATAYATTAPSADISDETWWKIMAIVGAVIAVAISIIGYLLRMDNLEMKGTLKEIWKELKENTQERETLALDVREIKTTIKLCPSCNHERERVRDSATLPKNRNTDPALSEW